MNSPLIDKFTWITAPINEVVPDLDQLVLSNIGNSNQYLKFL